MKAKQAFLFSLAGIACAGLFAAQDESARIIPIDPKTIQVLPAEPPAAEDIALRKLAISEALKQAQSDFGAGKYLSAANAIAQTFSVLGDKDDFESFQKNVSLAMLSKLDTELVITKDVPPETAAAIKKIIEVKLGGALSEAMQLSETDAKSAYEKLRGAFDAAALIGDEHLAAFLAAIDYVILKEGLGGVEKSEAAAEKIFARAKEISKFAEKTARLAISNIYHYSTFSQSGLNLQLKAVPNRNQKALEILEPILAEKPDSPDEADCHAYTLASDILLSPVADPILVDLGKIPPENQRRAAGLYGRAFSAAPKLFALEGTAPIKYASLLLNGDPSVKDREKAVKILEAAKDEPRSQILPRYCRVVLCALYSENPQDAELAAKTKQEYLKLFPADMRTAGFLENDISFAYKLGIGVEKNAEKSWQWALKGAKEGNFYSVWDTAYAGAKNLEEALAAFKKLPPEIRNDKALSAVRGLEAMSEDKIEEAASLISGAIKDPENVLPVANRDIGMLKTLAEKYAKTKNPNPEILQTLQQLAQAAQNFAE
ncbi:MAG: hypothetical protein IKS15_00185 [Opitutales bacterium]|nr:hypothetical protein [Opitutales bacterium]